MEPPFPIPFAKMSGTGNDFIVIDHRRPFLQKVDLPAFARSICTRKFSVGADGLILIEETAGADFRWQFFNADGSLAEMCGNGARCAARFAFEKKIAPARMRFQTLAGEIQAEMTGAEVKVRMTPPRGLDLDREVVLGEGPQTVHSLNTGVPHAVLFTEDNAAAPVVPRGREIRHHAGFQPAGTNANFVQVLGESALSVRTYERGVEDETMACGTGAVASAIVAAVRGLVRPPVAVTTSGGEQLTIHFQLNGRQAEDVYLQGPALIVYEGQLTAEALYRPPGSLIDKRLPIV
ncbi:MAG: diaminopimelate epimerase [Desulfobacteraceae bacterium]|nr:diaminopimelate epimerase [Desulfobacteraceae bacterium]